MLPGICPGRLHSSSRRLWTPMYPALCPTSAACCPSLSELLPSLQVSAESAPASPPHWEQEQASLLQPSVTSCTVLHRNVSLIIIQFCLFDSKKPGARTPRLSTEHTVPGTQQAPTLQDSGPHPIKPLKYPHIICCPHSSQNREPAGKVLPRDQGSFSQSQSRGQTRPQVNSI